MVKNLFINCLLTFVVSFSITTSAMADDFDNNNYRPENSSVKVEESNLPLVFIDTRHGSESPNIIHKD